MSATLFTPPKYYRSYRIEIAAGISGVKLTKQDLKNAPSHNSTNFVYFKDNKVELFEANAIASHVGNDQLRSKGNEAQVLQWCVWADTVVAPAVAACVYPSLGVTQSDPQQADKGRKVLMGEVLNQLNKHLESRTFLVGERITNADITVACNLLLPFEHIFDPKVRQGHAHVTRWFSTVLNQPAAIKVLGGEPKLCTTESKPVQGGKQQQQKGGKGDGGGKKKQPQQQAASKKAEEKKPAEKFLTAAEREELEKDKKPKDPFMALPKGTFDMDEWKRMISNNDPKTVALPWLWEHVDKENYSFWTCKYLYPEELKMIFMTSNSVGGMFQRLEKLRKHAYGVMCIFGEDKNNDIRGVWLWKGKDLAFNLDEDLQLDYDLYNWNKLDVNKAEDKKMVEQYFAQDFAGTNFNQAKVYK